MIVPSERARNLRSLTMHISEQFHRHHSVHITTPDDMLSHYCRLSLRQGKTSFWGLTYTISFLRHDFLSQSFSLFSLCPSRSAGPVFVLLFLGSNDGGRTRTYAEYCTRRNETENGTFRSVEWHPHVPLTGRQTVRAIEIFTALP